MNRKRKRGQGLVEFALILPLLLLIMVGIFEFGRIIFLYANLFNAAREGARYGLTHPQDYQGILGVAQERVTMLQLDNGDLAVSMDTGPASTDTCTMSSTNDCASYAVVGNRVKVTISRMISPITPFFEPFINDLNLTTDAARTIQRVSMTVSTPEPPTGPAPGDPGTGDDPGPGDPGGSGGLVALKTADVNQAEPGDVIVYTVSITNTTDSHIRNVQFTDTLDQHTTLVSGSLSPSGDVTDNGDGTTTLTVDVGMVRKNSSQTIEYRVTVDDPFASDVFEVTNQGSVSADGISNFTTNEVTTAIRGNVSLEAEKTDDVAADDGVEPGDVIAYTITINNTGNRPASNVVFADTPDANTTLNAGTVATSLGDVELGNTEGDSLVRVNVGTLDGNDSAVITFEVTVIDPFPDGVAQVTNTGTISSDETESLTASESTNVIAGPAISGYKRGMLYQDVDQDNVIGPGDVLYYEIVFTNYGNQSATDVVITDDDIATHTTLDRGSVEVNPGTASITTNPLQVQVAELQPGERVSINFKTTIHDDLDPSVTAITNEAVASSSQLGDVTASDTVPVATDPIVIARPVVAGAEFVKGTALPGQTLTLEVLRSDLSFDPITTQSDINDGSFSFDLTAGGITLSEGNYVLVKGDASSYDSQDIARVEAAPEGNYITLGNVCLDPAGDTIIVDGYNWSTSNNQIKTIEVELLDGDEVIASTTFDYDDAGTFTTDLVVQNGLSGGPYTVKATGYKPNGQIFGDPATAEIALCAEEPELEPDIQVESFYLKPTVSTAVVPGPSPTPTTTIGTYERITVTVVLTNTSTTNVTSLFEVDLYVDPDEDAFLFEQDSVDHIGVPVLAGNASVEFDMYVPDGFSDMETHTLTVKADTFEQILEIEEDLNVKSLTASATYTNTNPTPSPTPTPTQEITETYSIQGLTWMIVQGTEFVQQSGVELYAHKTVSDTTFTYGPVYSDNLGRYTLENLPADPDNPYTVTGEYWLLETTNEGPKRVRYYAEVTVTITDKDITDVYLLLEPQTQ